MQELSLITGVIKELAAKYGAKYVWLFGSDDTGRQPSGSDLDLVVDMEAGRDFLDLIWFKEAVEEQLGIKIDVAYAGAMSSYLRKSVLKDERLL